MAGGFLGPKDPKWKNISKNSFSSEVLKDSQQISSSPKTDNKPSFGLKGILGLNQKIEFNKPKSAENKVLFGQVNHLDAEFQQLIKAKQNELQKSIEELRIEIQKLIKNSAVIKKEIEIAADANIVEISEYQITYLQRIKTFFATINQSISESSLWLSSLSTKKKKKNAFWSTVKNKKAGGEQYLFSSEHSVARSAG